MDLTVTSATGTYPVHMSRDVGDMFVRVVAGRRAIFVSSPASGHRADALADTLTTSSPRFELVDGEQAKTLAHLERLLVWFGSQRVGRADVVVAVGGGTVTDLVGFAAGVWCRGVPWIAAPTTVAGAVDAGIGGKTAVNTAAGKNTAGRLWDPDAVVTDATSFDTLPAAALADGLAEVVKVACSHHPKIIDRILDGPGLTPGPWLDGVVEIAARVAGDVASGRFGPGANPDVLSLGHEIAHALEALSGFRVAHGAAVNVGLRFVHLLGDADSNLVDPALLERALTHCTLPLTATAAGVDVPWAAVRLELGNDKRMAGQLRFLIPLRDGVTWSDDLPETALASIWETRLRA